MGVVHEAINTWTHRRVALKLMHPGLPRTVQRRLFEEARTASRLSHPNVVDVLDMGAAEDGSLFLVQELLEGEDLHERLDRVGRLAASEVLRVFLPVIDALASAHELGIVHRDVKPSNIVLARDPRGVLVPKLVDFGIAKRVDDHAYTRITLDGTLLGTPHYMAPEQILDDEVGPPADVWSIGVCLYEALTGRVPYESTQLHLLLREISGLDATSPRLLVGVHDAFASPIRAALSIEPALRPTMRELATMLASIGDADDVRTVPPPAGYHSLDELDDDDDSDPTVVELQRVSVPSVQRVTIDESGPMRAALRIGIVNDARDLDSVQLRDAFRSALDRACEITRFRSYAELVDSVGEGDVDLAWLPPVAYVRAARLGAVRMVVAVERDGRAQYASALLGRRGAVSSYADVAGRRAVWVDNWSAAGYLVPRALLCEHGIDPDLALRSQGFVGSYEAVLDALAAGTADVGAAFCTVGADGEIVRRPWSEAHGVSVIDVSAPIPGDTFCASALLPEDVAREVLASLCDEVATAPLVKLVGAARLAPGIPERYRGLERALLVGRSEPGVAAVEHE
ncbi:Serine/threonine protein kinase [Sandaracinus amylolyticus]|uniref:non-specific serine/threonine protein kinase n=2 Tax=Sandaracinus amylolyticus TaxID=927083 RepID=A0A0F6W1B8_9BACT|nr:Serine/threonine protein kinase [Sandaracinus amylolyticus]